MAQEKWKVEPGRSKINFTVKHMVISKVQGSFSRFSGTWLLDPDHPETSSMEAMVDVKSIDTRDRTRDEHLISSEFFDSETYPFIRFQSSKMEPRGKDRWSVDGVLSMHGLSRPCHFEMKGDPLIGISVEFPLNRKDFNLTWNKMIEAGGIMVGEEISVSLKIDWVKEALSSREAWAPLG